MNNHFIVSYTGKNREFCFCKNMTHAELKAFTRTGDGYNNASSCYTVSIIVSIEVVLSEGKIKIRKHICEVVPPVDKILVAPRAPVKCSGVV